MTSRPDNTGDARRVHKVTVSMDGLRTNLARDFSGLVRFLNEAFKNRREFDWDILRDIIDELRTDVGVLHCVYDDEQEHFSDLSDATKHIVDPIFPAEE